MERLDLPFLGLEIETLISEKCERFLNFSVFQFSTFSPEVRTILEKFEFSTFCSEEIGHPQRVSRIRNSGSRANSEVSYQTGDLYRSLN